MLKGTVPALNMLLDNIYTEPPTLPYNMGWCITDYEKGEE